MTIGHTHAKGVGHDVSDSELAELQQYMADPKFEAALRAYRQEDGTHVVPYLAGSDNAGTTVYFHKPFYEAINAGKVALTGKPFDPRPFIRVHETVEGALIRLYGLDYAKAHRLATMAERSAVDAVKLPWPEYQNIYKPFVAAAERAGTAGAPPDLLLVPYEGTRLYGPLSAAQGHPAGDEGKPDEKQRQTEGLEQEPSRGPPPPAAKPYAPPFAGPGAAQPESPSVEAAEASSGAEAAEAPPGDREPLMSHEDAGYHVGPNPKNGDHCGICQHFIAPDQCRRVKPPIRANDGCRLFLKQEGQMAKAPFMPPMQPPMQMPSPGAVSPPAPDAGAPPMPTPAEPGIGGLSPDMMRSHQLSIGGATHLHKAGHITAAHKDKIQTKSRAVLASHKAKKAAPLPTRPRFGTLAPPLAGGPGKKEMY